jgi:hypothetical protein
MSIDDVAICDSLTFGFLFELYVNSDFTRDGSCPTELA